MSNRAWGAVLIVQAVVFAMACGTDRAFERGATPTVASANDAPHARPSPGPSSPAIDRASLPLKLRIPSAPDDASTAVEASETDFGDYLQAVDLAAGTARLIGSGQVLPRANRFEVPALSPDRTRIAYESLRTVAVVDIASGNVVTFPLPDAAPTPSPCLPMRSSLSWAPDSTRLAVNTEAALLVLDTGDGSYRAIAENARTPGRCALAWSPDGTWIVFSSGWQLSRVHPDGSDRLDASTGSAAAATYYGGPAEFIWSPDSRRFYFSGMTGIAGKGFASMSFVSGLDLHPTGIPIGDTVAWQTAPMNYDVHELPFIQSLSASGTRAAYRRSDHDADWSWTDYLETRAVDGTDSRTLATFKSGGGSIAEVPMWSPDDALIAYPLQLTTSSGYAGSVRLARADGTADVLVALGPPLFKLVSGRGISCGVATVGWLSTTSLLTWITCEGTE